MAFADEKLACLDLVKAFNCDRVQWVDANLNSYDDVLPVFLANLPKMECYPDYMYSLIACFDIVELNSRGIYYNDPALGSVTDATLIIKCSATDVTVTVPSGDILPEFVVAGASVIDLLEITGGGSVGSTSVSTGAQVKLLKTTGSSWIDSVRVSGCRTCISSLKTIDASSDIRSVYPFGGGYFGGYNCAAPTGTCADDVTTLASSKITSNSITITWVNPVNTINTLVYYRLNNTPSWLLGTQVNGDGVVGAYAVDGVGFIFRGLKMDTYYDFKVVNICSNGHSSPGVTDTFQTTY